MNLQTNRSTNCKLLAIWFAVASSWVYSFQQCNIIYKQTKFLFAPSKNTEQFNHNVLKIFVVSKFKSIQIWRLFSSFRPFFFSFVKSMLFLPTLDYDKTIYTWFTLYLPCFLYVVQASTVNFKAYCVCTHIDSYLWVSVYFVCKVCVQPIGKTTKFLFLCRLWHVYQWIFLNQNTTSDCQ